MSTLSVFSPTIFRVMSEINNGSGGTVGGNANADGDFIGRDLNNRDNNVNIHFDRASNWDEEREVLTDRQRIRDLEIYVFGDRRGLTVGVMRQMRSHLIWLVVLSLLQFLAIVMQAVLIWSILRGGV